MLMDAAIFRKMDETGASYWWYAGKKCYLRELLGEPDSAIEMRILDLGCGTGTLLPFLNQYGSLVGLEPSSDAVLMAHSMGAGAVVQASAAALPFRSGSFSLVAAFDCLEHVTDDHHALDAIRHLLSSTGRLLVSVPAHPFLSSRRDVQLGHIRRYTRQSLRELLETTGFSVAYLGYGYACLFLPLLLEAIRDRLTKPPARMRSDIRDLPEPWNNWLAKWLSIEARIAMRIGLPFGTSLFALAHVKR